MSRSTPPSRFATARPANQLRFRALCLSLHLLLPLTLCLTAPLHSKAQTQPTQSEQTNSAQKPASPTPKVQALLDAGDKAELAAKHNEALSFYQEALDQSRQLKDRLGEAFALLGSGLAYYNTNQIQKALEVDEQAFILVRQIGDKQGEGFALEYIGLVYDKIGQPQKALEFYQQALLLFQQLGDKYGEAIELNNISGVYLGIGQPQKALELLHQGLLLFRQLGDIGHEATALGRIGSIYAWFEQYQKAFEFLQPALPLLHQVGDKENEIYALFNIGSVYLDAGQPQKALEFYQQAFLLSQQVGDKRREAITLNYIGLVYNTIHQPQKALEFYQQALPFFRQVADKGSEANELNNIGLVYDTIDQPQKALEFYHQALLFFRQAGDRRGEAAVLNNIGGLYALRQPQKALEFCQKALFLVRQTGSKAHNVDVLNTIGTIETYLHQYQKGYSHLFQAVAMLEDLRTKIGGYGEAKSAFLASRLSVYYRALNAVLKTGQSAEAFALAQKTKARTLLDLLTSGRVDLSQVLTPEEQQKEQELRQRTNFLNASIIHENTLDAVASRTRVESLRTQLHQAESDLQVFTDQLYARHPDLARKRCATTASLTQIARALPEDTALLEYVQIEQKSLVLFVVTSSNGKPVLHTYRIPIAFQQLQKDCQDLKEACGQQLRYQPLARLLGEQLLRPALKALQGKKRLVICPDGLLWNVPFQALLVPGAPTSTGATHEVFLWERYDLSYAYSATMVETALTAHKAPPSAPLRSMLVVANPNFGSRDRFDYLNNPFDQHRLTPARPQTGTIAPTVDPGRPISDATRSASDLTRKRALAFQTRDGGIKPLPGTQQEADKIHDLFPDATLYTQDLAQESTVKAEAGKYRYLHFATHGYLNDDAPLYSAIILAAPHHTRATQDNTAPDKPGEKPTDSPKPDGKKSGEQEEMHGMLTAKDIFGMTLHADLVTLSTCNSARGEIQTGEGIVGLSYAFSVAGVPTQVASQWTVSDRTAPQLMADFYRNLKAGKPKSEALRQAALKMLHDKQHSHPYYWAPFILLGDWRR